MSELSTSDTAVLDLLERMTADPVEPSSLDGRTMFLVRLAALVASDAPTVSYAHYLTVAGEVDLTVDDVRRVLTAIAPIVGSSRVAAATARIVEAASVVIEIAERMPTRTTSETLAMSREAATERRITRESCG